MADLPVAEEEGGFLVPQEFLTGYWRRRAWPIRWWRRLRDRPVDDWIPGEASGVKAAE